MKVSIVVGNPKPRSRTRAVAEAIVDRLGLSGATDRTTIDLADYQAEVFDWSAARSVPALLEGVASSDLVVVASPTYKATFTGLLKAFLDRYPAGGLAGVVAVPVMTGGDTTHALAPQVGLTPLLLELGAIVLGRGYYFVIDQMDRLDDYADATARSIRTDLARVVAVARGIDEGSGE
ncbi:MAG: NAD(P)H-dependent oxidoreductase [Dactylosporangium sp.]|nr:NAD(P)H-dependent oxidoreductase [Dactylosporangium sp.]